MPRLLLAAPFLLVLHADAQAPEDSRPSVNLNFASWNRISGWLARLDGLRRAA